MKVLRRWKRHYGFPPYRGCWGYYPHLSRCQVRFPLECLLPKGRPYQGPPRIRARRKVKRRVTPRSK